METSQTDTASAELQRRAQPPESPEEVKQRIRDTRRSMSDTIDQIEYRISPNHMKHEAKDFLNERADEFRKKYHPKQIAQKAGKNMKNTISEHPVPSIVAGLSLGYLLMKSGGEKQRRSHTNGEHDPSRSSARRSHGSPTSRSGRQEDRQKRSRASSSKKGRGERGEAGTGEQIRAATEEAADKTREMKDQAQEMTEEAGDWVEETGQQARRQARSAKHSVERGTHQMQDYIHKNPLVAGAVALGTGALLGGMFPSTRTEDEWMGEARDDVMERAGKATEDTMRRAGEAAENVAEEAKKAASDVAETTKEEAKEVANESKKNRASDKEAKSNEKRQAEGESKSVGSAP